MSGVGPTATLRSQEHAASLLLRPRGRLIVEAEAVVQDAPLKPSVVESVPNSAATGIRRTAESGDKLPPTRLPDV
jgi:hypothetical protein